MKKSTIIILVVLALLVIWGVTGYNGLVTMDENVSGQWSNVETQYQRRADLIPSSFLKIVFAVKIYNYLVGEGIIVRNRNSISLCGNCLRVTVGTRMENDKLIEALQGFII